VLAGGGSPYLAGGDRRFCLKAKGERVSNPVTSDG